MPLSQLLRRWACRTHTSSSRQPARMTRWRPTLEMLEDRLAPAALTIDASGNAIFSGLAGNDTVTLARNAATGSIRSMWWATQLP